MEDDDDYREGWMEMDGCMHAGIDGDGWRNGWMDGWMQK